MIFAPSTFCTAILTLRDALRALQSLINAYFAGFHRNFIAVPSRCKVSGTGTVRHWLAERIGPGYFTMCAVVRQMRDGHDPLTDVQMTAAELADVLKEWRAEHGFSQRQAAAATGSTTGRAILPRLARNGNRLQLSFTRYFDRADITLIVQASDSLTGPWTDLAQSINSAPFTLLAPGAIGSEIPDPTHPSRFLRLSARTP